MFGNFDIIQHVIFQGSEYPEEDQEEDQCSNKGYFLQCVASHEYM